MSKEKPSSKGETTEHKPDSATYVSAKSIKQQLKQRGISNSGGQFAHQTDNKQATVNKGQGNPLVQGKKRAAKLPSKSGPKKK